MVGLLAVLVADGDAVVAGVVLAEVADGQGAVGPVAAALQEGLEKKKYGVQNHRS